LSSEVVPDIIKCHCRRTVLFNPEDWPPNRDTEDNVKLQDFH
jgi:hypothetical protein